MERNGSADNYVWVRSNWNGKKGIEIVQNKAAMRGLGANRHVAVEALRGDMGWSTFEERKQNTEQDQR